MKKTVKNIEIPMVRVEIEFSERFYDEVQTAKKSLEEKYPEYKMTDGEYIERCIEDFMIMISTLEAKVSQIESMMGPTINEDNEHIYG